MTTNFSPIIHIGFPKSGSTWLQEIVFKAEHGFYLPQIRSVEDEINVFTTCNPYTFDPTWARSYFEEDLKQAADNDLIPVISNENFVGGPFSGAGYAGFSIAGRLQETFPQAKILIVIREQSSTILSAYKWRVQDGGQDDLSRFIGASPIRLGYQPRFRLYYLEYDQVIRRYQELFGEKGVLVLPLEMLSSNPEEFCNMVAEFCGVPSLSNDLARTRSNVGQGSFSTEVRRLMNNCVNTIQNPYGVANPFRNKVIYKLSQIVDRVTPNALQEYYRRKNQEQILSFTEGYYQESNQRTSKLINLDLSEFGYK
jgi:hypothetical protein